MLEIASVLNRTTNKRTPRRFGCEAVQPVPAAHHDVGRHQFVEHCLHFVGAHLAAHGLRVAGQRLGGEQPLGVAVDAPATRSNTGGGERARAPSCSTFISSTPAGRHRGSPPGGSSARSSRRISSGRAPSVRNACVAHRQAGHAGEALGVQALEQVRGARRSRRRAPGRRSTWRRHAALRATSAAACWLASCWLTPFPATVPGEARRRGCTAGSSARASPGMY